MAWEVLLQVCPLFQDLFFWVIFLARASGEDSLFCI